MDTGSRKAVIAAMLANSGIAVAKFVGFAFTGASSMLAEAVHSVADTTNQGLLLWGGSAAQKAATAEHAFGYGRERYFWSFIVALVIFSLGGLFAITEGIDKLRHPHMLTDIWWAVGILVISIGLETVSFRTAIVEAIAVKGKATWWEFIKRTKSPELPVVLLEDLGALVGLVLALGGIVIATTTGDARWDAIGSIAIGVLLVSIGFTLAIEMKALLIGESADPDDEASMRAAIETSDSVRRLIHMRTQHIGPEQILLAAKIEFDHGLSVADLAHAIDDVETRIRERVPAAQVIYLEPDLFYASRAEGDGKASSAA